MTHAVDQPICHWHHEHPNEPHKPAVNRVLVPGNPDGGVDWFGGSEPDINMLLCDTCTGIFIEMNGGEDNVIVQELAIALPPENPFSTPRREASNA